MHAVSKHGYFGAQLRSPCTLHATYRGRVQHEPRPRISLPAQSLQSDDTPAPQPLQSKAVPWRRLALLALNASRPVGSISHVHPFRWLCARSQVTRAVLPMHRYRSMWDARGSSRPSCKTPVSCRDSLEPRCCRAACLAAW